MAESRYTFVRIDWTNEAQMGEILNKKLNALRQFGATNVRAVNVSAVGDEVIVLVELSEAK